MRDLLRELDGETGRPIPSWKPEQPGEAIAGRVVRFETRKTKRFDEQPVVVIEQDNDRGRLLVWLSNVVLRELFGQHGVQPGDRIAVKYLGYPEGKNYKNFALVHERAEVGSYV